jgi:3D (Asp-Asp-Asp) domain-containing protein
MRYFLIILLCIIPIGATEKEYNAILTHYCSCQKCCSWHMGKDGKPKFNLRPNVTKIVGQTASGVQAKEGVTLAMPKCFPFGTKVYVDGKLLGIVQDRGGAIIVDEGRIKIDVFINDHKRALKLGVKRVMTSMIVYPDMDTSKIIRRIK